MINDEIMRAARGWVADCQGRTELAPVELTMRYVAAHYPGGWRAFRAEYEACSKG